MRNVAKLLGWRFEFHGERGHGIDGILAGGGGFCVRAEEEEPRGKGRRDGTPVAGAVQGRSGRLQQAPSLSFPGFGWSTCQRNP
jgi:hypothetical protein